MIELHDLQEQQCGETYPGAFEGSLEAAEQDAHHWEMLQQAYAEPSIVDALYKNSNWYAEFPPVSRTDIPPIDLELADAFRMLAYLGEVQRQLNWIERQVNVTTYFTPNDNIVRTILIRWWLDIFHAEHPLGSS